MYALYWVPSGYLKPFNLAVMKVMQMAMWEKLTEIILIIKIFTYANMW